MYRISGIVHTDVILVVHVYVEINDNLTHIIITQSNIMIMMGTENGGRQLSSRQIARKNIEDNKTTLTSVGVVLQSTI